MNYDLSKCITRLEQRLPCLSVIKVKIIVFNLLIGTQHLYDPSSIYLVRIITNKSFHNIAIIIALRRYYE